MHHFFIHFILSCRVCLCVCAISTSVIHLFCIISLSLTITPPHTSLSLCYFLLLFTEPEKGSDEGYWKSEIKALPTARVQICRLHVVMLQCGLQKLN